MAAFASRPTAFMIIFLFNAPISLRGVFYVKSFNVLKRDISLCFYTKIIKYRRRIMLKDKKYKIFKVYDKIRQTLN